MLGVVFLLGLTVALAASVAVAMGAVTIDDPVPTAAFDLTVDGEDERIELDHVAGDTLDTTTIDLYVTVDGEPLIEQPPIPFFAAHGFDSGPTGAFNPSGGTEWSAGETASVRLAATNHPNIDAGDGVSVRIVHDDRTIATVESTAS